MINDPDIRDQAYQYFLDEIPGLLETIEQELLALNQSDEGRSLKVNHIMRATHTLKGGAANVGLETLQKIAHSLEDIFKALYHPELTMDSEIKGLLLESYECIRLPAMAQLTQAAINEQEILERSADIFAKLHDKLGHYMADQSAFPPSEELGIDVVKTFFEDVVPQRLEEIAKVLETNNPEQIQTILYEQIEVLLSLGESLNLPGFEAIAKMTIAALNNAPEQVQVIAKTALEDFRKGQKQILEGDRVQGGNPSDFLQQLAHNSLNEQLLDAPKQPSNNFDENFSKSLNEVLGNKQLIEQHTETKNKNSLSEKPDNLDHRFLAYSSNKSQEKTKPEKRLSSQNIRVKLEGLERLNHIVGELVINHNKQAIKKQKIQELIDHLLENLEENQQSFYQLNNLIDSLLMLVEYSQNPLNLSCVSLDSSISCDLNISSSLKLSYSYWLKSDPYLNLSQQIKTALKSILQSTKTAEKIRNLTKESNQAFKKQERTLFTMRDELIETRMSPLGNLLSRFPRLIEQLSTVQNKQVELRLKGSHILVDKAIEQKLYDPLLHLVRNAFDHGIETPEIRRKLGKPETGVIEIDAYHQGSRTIIEVRDDGQGLDFERIRNRVLELHLMTPEEVSTLSDSQLLEFLFEPGFSTSSQVNEISGRGVGLDIVHSQLEALKGKIAIESRQNQGTTFSLQIPLTLSIAKLMVCQTEGIVYSLLPDVIEKIILPQSKEIKLFKGRKVLYWQTETDNYNVPIRKLSELINYNRIFANQTSKLNADDNQQSINPILLLRRHQGLIGLEVDQVLGEQELVIRPLGTTLNPPNYVYGCSILSDNRLSLVIDGAALVNQTQNHPLTANQSATKLSDKSSHKWLSKSPGSSDVLLVVDDSISLRQTATLTLQKLGYHVLQAADGIEALEELERLKGISLVICDLDMPRMNGFEFLKTLRQHPELSHLPVITLTSHDSEPYRQLAQQLGTTAYMTKPYKGDELVETILHLIQGA
ncbi:CheA signal transduction histidine kinase [Rippkaea orientalis PCC 8801]|uniref:histidine kinase n=1 Tax=Rippkaea orientalis (strain PCC 8801 / RF-1) TaxID=41431 RepID=B7K5C9_RIPO1|nr:hybrid sensor histidine kinase/response regulator [Rippkaea orientalis]ACK67955.1 CheA signal transduction histidine kinase [Rippkaea orientalis PCC 8801]